MENVGSSQDLFILEKVSKVYLQANKETWALSNVSIRIPFGMTAVIGESGSGKTTLLSLLGAIDSPTEGDILYHDVTSRCFVPISCKPLFTNTFFRCHLGIVFQDLKLINHLKIWQNIAFSLVVKQGMTWRQAKDRALDLLTKVDLIKEAFKRPQQLSGGEQQRVAICRAIISRPRLILADEPTGNLDGENSKRVLDMLHRVSDIPIILVTHNIRAAMDYCKVCFQCRKTEKGNIVEEAW